MSNIQKTLERLSKMNQQNTKTSSSSLKFFKAKPGKNNLLVLPTPMTGDPFMEWGTHKSLLDVPFKDTACEKHNRQGECLVCQVIDDLKKQNWKGNYPIWKPIELKIRYYSPVIDLDNIEEGVQFWGYGKSVLSQFETWLLNLEGGETSFYDKTSPEKVIVTYNPEASPADMYKLDKKATKAMTEAQYTEWEKSIKPLNELMPQGKGKEDIATILDNYMQKLKGELDATNTDTPEAADETSSVKKVNKLDSLKSK